jgi:hypothetical protein
MQAHKKQLAMAYESTSADLERQRLANGQLRLSEAVKESVNEYREEAVQILAASAPATPPQQQHQLPIPQSPPGSRAGAPSVSVDGGLGMSAEQFWARPLLERIDICTRIFYQAKAAHQTLQEGLPEGTARPDAFALDAE